MKIIPVIDLKDGAVVHAKHGNREHYQPIHTPLCQSSDIYQVIEAFLTLYDFDTFYIADLNAITRQGNHDALISDVLARFPNILFWVDRGYQIYQKQPDNFIPVLGSECYTNETIAEFGSFDKHFILSLDYSFNQKLGADRLFSDSDSWPETVIIMTLARVGSNQGVDLDKLAGFCRQYPQNNFVAAGGIRHCDDLKALQQIGIQQALVASALHSGVISGQDIGNL
ncbi:MAG: HisA/HisF-related TIM barrel protein [Methylococcaceae bacterium]